MSSRTTGKDIKGNRDPDVKSVKERNVMWDDVARMYLDFKTRASIITYCQENYEMESGQPPCVTTIDRVLRDVKKFYVPKAEANKEKYLETKLAEYEQLADRLDQIGEYKEARGYRDMINKMRQLYTTKVEVEGKMEIEMNFGDGE